MPRRIANTQLNARTIDIINTIRANASAEYQQLVPAINTEEDIPRVGEVLYGYPAMANQFISALVNRIALVRVKAATFNNAYAELKKGYLEFGETVEEVFVNICKAREFSVEKAAAREFRRSVPDVRSAFHTMNWRVQYPVTIQDEDLRMAFLSADGVQDLITKIISSVYTAAEYDEYLLFKYLIIKGISHGKMFPVVFDSTNMSNAAVAFRGTSNMLTFMKTDYNASGVHTNTEKNDQFIFMDATFNAQYDVNVLAAAFNMDKAEFMGHLKLIDDFNTFDNERFNEIRANSTMIEEVTADELAIMANVKGVLVDREWFQIYDNQIKFTDTYVASGEYWNYFLNVWKTVSYSPFSNAVVFVTDFGATNAPTQFAATVASKGITDNGSTIFALEVEDGDAALTSSEVKFVQTEQATRDGVAVHRYGGIIIPEGKTYKATATLNGATYVCATDIGTATAAGTKLTFAKQ